MMFLIWISLQLFARIKNGRRRHGRRGNIGVTSCSAQKPRCRVGLSYSRCLSSLSRPRRFGPASRRSPGAHRGAVGAPFLASQLVQFLPPTVLFSGPPLQTMPQIPHIVLTLVKQTALSNLSERPSQITSGAPTRGVGHLANDNTVCGDPMKTDCLCDRVLFLGDGTTAHSNTRAAEPFFPPALTSKDRPIDRFTFFFKKTSPPTSDLFCLADFRMGLALLHMVAGRPW